MVRGTKSRHSRQPSGSALSGHLDDWPVLAVDYLDDHLDASSKDAVQAHLQACPECSRRLAAQQTVLALFMQAPLLEAPATLESQVLERAFRSNAPAPASQRLVRRDARRSRRLLSPAGPWLPALAGGAAVVALVLALAITRDPATLSGTATTAAVGLASETGATQTARDAGAGLPTSTDAATLASGDASVDSAEAGVTMAAPGLVASAALQPTGPYVQDRSAMVSSLSGANTPAYFFFDTKDGGLITSDQADTVASHLTTATGLQLMSRDLSSGVKAFAAYVPRDDSAAIVDLLRSICGSLQLSVCLSLQPGAEVTTWAGSMLQDKYSLAELSASPTSPPVYTTSTASTLASSDKSPKTTLLDEAGTHVLVVIFMAIQD